MVQDNLENFNMRFASLISLMFFLALPTSAQTLPNFEIIPYRATAGPGKPVFVFSAYKVDRKNNALYQCAVSFDVTPDMKGSCGRGGYEFISVKSSLVGIFTAPADKISASPIWLIDNNSGIVSFCLPASKCIQLKDLN